jgi:hypothetical protein
MSGTRFGSSALALAAALSLAPPLLAAELPTQSKALSAARKGAEPPKGLPICDIGGVQGVLSPGGVCVRMSGYISAGVAARQLR